MKQTYIFRRYTQTPLLFTNKGIPSIGSRDQVSIDIGVPWDNWYLIVRILKNLGYQLSDDPDTIYTENGPIKAWVRSILASVQEDPQGELER